MTVSIKQLDFSDTNFSEELNKALAWDSISDAAVQDSVASILSDIKTRGDDAVVEWTNKLDRLKAGSIEALEISQEELKNSLYLIPTEQAEALQKAADRIRRYHEKQKQDYWQ